MKKNIFVKGITFAFFILLLTSIFSPYAIINFRSDVNTSKNATIQNLDAKSVFIISTPPEHVSFENVSFSGNILIRNNSIVTIKNSDFLKNSYISVLDDSQLTIENVTTDKIKSIIVGDNAILHIINSDLSTGISINTNDESALYIENSSLAATEISSFDYSQIYLYNTTIESAFTYDNSSIQATNTTALDDWTFMDNSSASLYYSVFKDSLRFEDTSYGELYNITMNINAIYMEDSTTVSVNNSQLAMIYMSGYYTKADVFNSTMGSMYSYSEYMSFLTNVTVNTLSRGFIVNGVGNMTAGMIHMEPGYNINPNIITNAYSTIATTINNTAIRVEGYEFGFYDNPSIYRVHAYDATLSISKSKFTYIQLTNSSASMFDSMITNALTLNDSTVFFNDSYIATGYAENSKLFGVNTTYYSSLSITESNASFISSHTSDLDSRNSKVVLENVTEMASTKIYSLTNSELSFINVTFNTLTLVSDPSSIFITRSNFDSSTFTAYNTTIQTLDSVFSNTDWKLYENAELFDINSTFDDIYVYGPNAHLSMENDSASGIYYTTMADSTGLIKNVDINKLYSVYLDVFIKTENKITVENSTITSLAYSASATTGVVNIINHRFSGSGTYDVSVELDSKTNVSSFKFVFLYANGSILTIKNTTNIFYAEINNAEATFNNISVDTAYIANTQYAISDSIFSYLFISLRNFTTFVEEISYGIIHTYPSTGTIFNITVGTLGIFGGEAWVTNATIMDGLLEILSTTHVENSTINEVIQSFYFTGDGNVTNGVPYDYSSHGVVWGPNNSVNKNTTTVIFVYSGDVRIYNSTVFLTAVYNNSNLLLNGSRSDVVILHDDVMFTSNFSIISYLAMYDYANSDLHTSDVNDHLYLTNGSTLYFDTGTIETIEIDGDAHASVNNAEIQSGAFDQVIYTSNNAELTIRNSTIISSGIDTVLVIDDNGKVTLDNVTVDVTNTMYIFLLWNSSKLTFLESNITGSLNGILGYLYGDARLVLNDTIIFNGSSALGNAIDLFNTSLLESYNTTLLSLYLYDYANAYLLETNVSMLFAYMQSHFEMISSHYYYHTYTYFYLTGSATGYMTNVSIYSGVLERYTELILDSVYANYTGIFCGLTVEWQAKLHAHNTTISYIFSYFTFNRTDMGFVNLTDSSVDHLEGKISLYHYGFASIINETYTYDPTVDFYNHTILHNTNVTEKEYILNVDEFVDVNIKNSSFKHVSINRLVDTVNPSVSVSPETTEFEKGMLVPDMTWNITENIPDKYILKQNGTLIKSDAYESGVLITYNISALDVGFWEFEFIAYDRAGNSATVLSNVTVYASEAPVFTYAPSSPYIMTEGSTGNILNWTAIDRFPANYEIYVDVSLVASGNWSSGVEITYNIDHLTEGNYTVRIVVYDQTGNSTESTVNVIVEAPILPPGPGGIPLEYILIAVGIIIVLIVLIIVFKRLKGKK